MLRGENDTVIVLCEQASHYRDELTHAHALLDPPKQQPCLTLVCTGNERIS